MISVDLFVLAKTKSSGLWCDQDYGALRAKAREEGSARDNLNSPELRDEENFRPIDSALLDSSSDSIFTLVDGSLGVGSMVKRADPMKARPSEGGREKSDSQCRCDGSQQR